MEGRYSIEFGDLIEQRFKDRPMGQLSDAKEAVEQLMQHSGWVELAELVDALYMQKEKAFRITPAKGDPGDYALRMAAGQAFLNGMSVFFDAAATFPEKYDEIRRGVAGLVGVREE